MRRLEGRPDPVDHGPQVAALASALAVTCDDLVAARTTLGDRIAALEAKPEPVDHGPQVAALAAVAAANRDDAAALRASLRGWVER